MTLEDLRVFALVCEVESLSEAARRLGRTQPAVSQHVGRLERELDVALLERRSTGVVPTAAGLLLRDAALDASSALMAGVRRVAELREGIGGSLAITTGGTTVRHFLRGAVVEFRRRLPGVALDFISVGSTSRCLDVLRRGLADLALVTIEGDAPAGIERRTVATQELRLLVASDDPLASRRRIPLRDLPSVRHIALSEETSSRAYLERALAAEGISVRPRLTVDDFDTASLFVELGLGHAMVPAVQAHHFSTEGRVHSVRVTGLDPLPVGWAARRFDALPQSALAFLEIFQREMRAMRGIPGLRLLD